MDTSKLTTSTGFRYENSFAKSVEKFPTLARLATKATFGIPGLALTKVEDGLCECMTPLGICVAGASVLITAYCNINKYFKSNLSICNEEYSGNYKEWIYRKCSAG